MILTQNRPKTAKSSWHCSFNLLLGIFENRRETGHAQWRSLKSYVPWRVHNSANRQSTIYFDFDWKPDSSVTLMWQDIVNNLTTRLVVLMALEQSCLPMYQILPETFSWHLLSQQQAIKFCWVPKMRQKLFLTQRKFYGA